jgi:HPr kinase/phosphorylase
MTNSESPAIHATVVAIGRWGVVIMGPSGSGKSDLALRLIDRGATLVGDDYIAMINVSNTPVARSAPSLAGKIEVRGIGILGMDYIDSAPVRLCIELGDDGERFLEQWPVKHLCGFAIPTLKLNAFSVAAPIKAELALQSLVDADHWPVPSVDSEKAQ